MAARLLMAWPPRKPKRWTEDEISEDAANELDGLIEWLNGLDFDDGKPAIVGISSEARKLWIQFYNHHQSELSNLTDDLAAAFSKLEEIPARLALIFHCVDGDSGSVTADTMANAIQLTQWFKRETRRIYEALDESPDEQRDRKLLDWIRTKGGEVSVLSLIHI